MTKEQEWIGGKNPVLAALKSDRDLNKIWVAEGLNKQTYQEIMDYASKQKIVVQTVPRKRLDQMVDIPHQGIVASVAAYKYATLDDLFARAESRGEDPFFIMLDELEDPHNLGSILRTADAVGAHGVIIPKHRSVSLTSTVAKASTGAIEFVPVVRVTNLSQTVDTLKERGVWIAGTDAAQGGAVDYRYMDATLPLALIIGNEGKGMSPKLKKRCDFLYTIPMQGKITSLNASVATALLMYEVYRKRHPLKGGK